MPRKPKPTDPEASAEAPKLPKERKKYPRNTPAEKRTKQITDAGSVEAVYDFSVSDEPKDPNNPNSRADLSLRSYVAPTGTSKAVTIGGKNMPKGTVKPGAATLKAVMARLESVAEQVENAINTAAVTGISGLVDEVCADVRAGLNGAVDESDMSLIFPTGEEGDTALKAAVVRSIFRAANEASEPYREKRQRKAKGEDGDGAPTDGSANASTEQE